MKFDGTEKTIGHGAQALLADGEQDELDDRVDQPHHAHGHQQRDEVRERELPAFLDQEVAFLKLAQVQLGGLRDGQPVGVRQDENEQGGDHRGDQGLGF